MPALRPAFWNIALKTPNAGPSRGNDTFRTGCDQVCTHCCHESLYCNRISSAKIGLFFHHKVFECPSKRSNCRRFGTPRSPKKSHHTDTLSPAWSDCALFFSIRLPLITSPRWWCTFDMSRTAKLIHRTEVRTFAQLEAVDKVQKSAERMQRTSRQAFYCLLYFLEIDPVSSSEVSASGVINHRTAFHGIYSKRKAFVALALWTSKLSKYPRSDT